MAKKKRMVRNVTPLYRQLFISGYEHIDKSGNKDGNSKAVKQAEAHTTPIRGERCYHVSIPVIIEQISNDSGEYQYKISINAHSDIPIASFSKRGKKITGQIAHIPQEVGGKPDTFSLVYGIHKSGMRALSHTTEHPIFTTTAQIYGSILGIIDRAIQCTILQPENAQTNDDAGQRIESASTQKDVGGDKKTRRSKKVRAKILPETSPEETPLLVEIDRKVLGWGPANDDIRPIGMGSDIYTGGGIADSLANGETPDLGF